MQAIYYSLSFCILAFHSLATQSIFPDWVNESNQLNSHSPSVSHADQSQEVDLQWPSIKMSSSHPIRSAGSGVLQPFVSSKKNRIPNDGHSLLTLAGRHCCSQLPWFFSSIMGRWQPGPDEVITALYNDIDLGRDLFVVWNRSGLTGEMMVILQFCLSSWKAFYINKYVFMFD